MNKFQENIAIEKRTAYIGGRFRNEKVLRKENHARDGFHVLYALFDLHLHALSNDVWFSFPLRMR